MVIPDNVTHTLMEQLGSIIRAKNVESIALTAVDGGVRIVVRGNDNYVVEIVDIGVEDER